ncbi:MAG: mitochondrial fission ELM1 family protein [Gammaproteobacteria bacterium]
MQKPQSLASEPDLPVVWVLLGKGKGGNVQMVNLAESLGWPFETRQLVHNALNRIPNLLLGATTISVDKRRSDPLAPPWPDLVIAASRRSAPVARWIRKQSGGRTKLIHLFHVQAPLRHFDLIITLPQYRLPERVNVLHLTSALNRVSRDKLSTAAERWQAKFDTLPRPHIALIVGGNSSSYLLDDETARRLGREASAAASEAGGSLLISTTPRTPASAAEALFTAVDAPAFRYRWAPDDPDNPYFAFLALADRFIVTVDSASVPVEACDTGKPVALFEWPRRHPPGHWRRLLRRAPLRQVQAAMIYLGLFKPARDFDAYHRLLQQRGLVSRLGGPEATVRRPLEDGLALAVQRIRELIK